MLSGFLSFWNGKLELLGLNIGSTVDQMSTHVNRQWEWSRGRLPLDECLVREKSSSSHCVYLSSSLSACPWKCLPITAALVFLTGCHMFVVLRI